ncbi:MAG: SigB/SigF/SigG family RNA polymerase sigma factor [Bacillota bacterium]
MTRDCRPKAVLGEEEVHTLLKKAQAGDGSAREKLVEANYRLVASIVQRFLGRGYDYEDLFQVGCIGLLKAIAKFDFAYGVKFSTYAVTMIIGEIKRYLRDDGPLRVSRSLKETGARINRVREVLAGKLGREPAVSEIAAALGVPVEEVVAAWEAVQAPASLQDVVYGEGTDGIRREQRLALPEEDENSWLRKITVRELLACLPERERQVLRWRFFEERTQAEIAEELGVSQAQVSRIERQALEKLRETAGVEDLL